MISRDLSIDFLGVHFGNPFCLSSSPVGNCYEMCSKAYDAGWGGIVFKTIGPKSFLIDEVSPRFAELTKEGTPFVGFKNMEQIAEHPLEQNLDDLAKLKKAYPDKVLIASIMGPDAEDWTVLAKMTPNITDMVPVAKACMEGGADGIAAINTIKSITDLDLDRAIGLPVINGKSSVSGYSGKAVKPIALRFIQQLREGIPGLPISGIGGIETWEDALEFILLGASTLQVTTAVMQYGYRIVEDMKNGLMHYLEDHGVEHLSDLVGLANKNIVPAEELDRDYIVHPALKAEACIGCGRCYISCFDGAHQAIRWNETERRPDFDTEKCVGCLLCSLVCPTGAITKGEVVMKPNRIGRPEAKEI